MADLTIGQAAGIINAGLLFVQVTYPLAIAWVVAGVLGSKNTAATWSVAGRLLNLSLWPTILGSDSSTSRGVSRRINWALWISTGSLLILGIAGALAPLGLSAPLSPSSKTQLSFQYTPDHSSIGQGTVSHAEYKAGRICGNFNCPGQGTNYTDINRRLSTRGDTYFSTRYAQNVTDIFSSTVTGTLSGFFDIEYRTFTQERSSSLPAGFNSSGVPIEDEGNPYTQAAFRLYDSSILLNDGYQLVDGLILDLDKGGIGFRNHTAPKHNSAGAKWQEDILWIDPETACVDTNLTYQYTIDSSFSRNSYLINHGGFSNALSEAPPANWPDVQENPDLRNRAILGSRLNSHNILLALNETVGNTSIGKIYDVHDGLYEFVTYTYSPLANFPSLIGDVELDYTDSLLALQGFDSRNISGISKPFFVGGIFTGPPKRVNTLDAERKGEGRRWSSSVYSCASTLRASIKKVTFQLTGDPFIQNMSVVSVVPKDHEAMPLWAVEELGLPISEASPTWGIVEDKQQNNAALRTIRKDGLYIPASEVYSLNVIDHSSAGVSGLGAALYRAYSFDNSELVDAIAAPAFLQRWEKLANTVDKAPAGVNVLWTTYAANYVQGRRGRLTDGPKSASATGAVRLYENKIHYQLRYAIPAIIFLALYTITFSLLILLCAVRMRNVLSLSSLLKQTSVGRAVTNERFPQALPHSAKTGTWLSTLGGEQIVLRKSSAKQGEHAIVSEKGD